MSKQFVCEKCGEKYDNEQFSCCGQWVSELEPQQTTLDYQIEVMQAYRDGAEIEWRYENNTSNHWSDIEKPNWNWSVCNYRIKQEPKTRTMPDGSILPLPVSEPLEDGEAFWFVDISSSENKAIQTVWKNNLGIHKMWLERGLIYKTEQEAQQVADYIINKVLKVEG